MNSNHPAGKKYRLRHLLFDLLILAIGGKYRLIKRLIRRIIR